MKKMLLAIFSALCFGASAQITVTAATFPTAGDTLRFAVDTTVGDISLAVTPPGANQLWDFTGLQPASTFTTVYRPAASGMNFGSFPGAELLVLNQQGETYFNVTNNVVENMGYSGNDPVNLNLDVLAKFQPAIKERRAPINFFDVNQQTSNLSVPFSTENIPDTLFAGFPFVPDSIRFRVSLQRLEIIDAWGTCQIPGGQYNVLREKRTEYSTTGLDVKVPFLGWVDVGTFLPGGGGGGGGVGGFLGTDTTVTYRFYSGTEKEEIAVVTLDSSQTQARSIRYKNNGTTSVNEDPDAPGKAAIAAFPNPAVEWVRFDCTNLPPSDYTLKIFNIVGKVVWEEQYFISGNKSIRIELDDFKKGTYLYSLTNSEGAVIGTKRLVVVKP